MGVAVFDDVSHNSDEEVQESSHNKLLNAVSHLYKKQRLGAPKRSEPSLQVSEFHLAKDGAERQESFGVKLHDLAQALNSLPTHRDLIKHVAAVQRSSKTLPKPVETIEAAKIERSIGYENLKNQFNRWEAVVEQQRVADQIKFPLKQPPIVIHKSTDILTTFKNPTELEVKMAAVLNRSSLVQAEKKEKEVNDKFPLTLEEMIERRRMMARMRTQQSFREAKAARQSKIKSKKFHRVLRREKVKQQLKAFESLKSTDPEAALQRLEELERVRAEERMSLRHKSTGQWAKNKLIRAKYNKEARIELAEQLSKSRELTQKLQQSSEVDSDEDRKEEVSEYVGQDPDNPWVCQGGEVQKFVNDYRKYCQLSQKPVVNESSSVIESSQQSALGADSKNACDEDISVASPKKRIPKKGKLNINSKSKKLEDTGVQSTDTNKIVKIVKKVIKTKQNITPLPSNARKEIKKETIEITIGKRRCSNDSMYNGLKKPKSKGVVIKRGASGAFIVTPSPKRQSKPILNEGILNFATSNLISKKNKKVSKYNKVKAKKVEKYPSDIIDNLFVELEDKVEQSVRKRVDQIRTELNDEENSEETEVHVAAPSTPSLKMKKRVMQVEVDEALIEKCRSHSNQEKPVERKMSSSVGDLSGGKGGDIDPNKYLSVKPREIKSQLPDIMTGGDGEMDSRVEDEEEVKYLTMQEAFAEDDVVTEFHHEKEKELKKSKGELVDLSMPGWGTWGGGQLKSVPARKRKHFLIKFPDQERKDKKKPNVIINEAKDVKIKQHMVSELPHPFTSVRDYEASIRAPLGATWVTQSAHRKLTAPPLVTKMGAIIEPMDEDALLSNKLATPIF